MPFRESHAGIVPPCFKSRCLLLNYAQYMVTGLKCNMSVSVNPANFKRLESGALTAGLHEKHHYKKKNIALIESLQKTLKFSAQTG